VTPDGETTKLLCF